MWRGVYCARTVVQRAQHLGVEMPIAQAVVDLLDGRLKPQAAVAALMGRDAREEAEFRRSPQRVAPDDAIELLRIAGAQLLEQRDRGIASSALFRRFHAFDLAIDAGQPRQRVGGLFFVDWCPCRPATAGPRSSGRAACRKTRPRRPVSPCPHCRLGPDAVEEPAEIGLDLLGHAAAERKVKLRRPKQGPGVHGRLLQIMLQCGTSCQSSEVLSPHKAGSADAAMLAAYDKFDSVR